VAPSGCQQTNGTGCDNSFVTSDPLTGLVWDNLSATSTNNANDLDNGAHNWQILLAFDPPSGSRFEIAKFCDDLNVNGYTDWYLPAKNELNLVVRSGNTCSANTGGPTPNGCIRGTSTNPVVGGLVSDKYASSNEASQSAVYVQNLVDGGPGQKPKTGSYYFRCVRQAP